MHTAPLHLAPIGFPRTARVRMREGGGREGIGERKQGWRVGRRAGGGGGIPYAIHAESVV